MQNLDEPIKGVGTSLKLRRLVELAKGLSISGSKTASSLRLSFLGKRNTHQKSKRFLVANIKQAKCLK